MPVRFHVEPRDVPARCAARRLGLEEADFLNLLPLLIARNFPPADPTTGNFDLDAIDKWRASRHGELHANNDEPKPVSEAKRRLAALADG